MSSKLDSLIRQTHNILHFLPPLTMNFIQEFLEENKVMNNVQVEKSQLHKPRLKLY
jgi:hypothetical protein